MFLISQYYNSKFLYRRVLSWQRWILAIVRFSAIVLLYCFLALKVYTYKTTLANWQHETKVARSMVYNITVSSVPSKHKLYNFEILIKLFAPITMNIISNNYLCYLIIKVLIFYLLQYFINNPLIQYYWILFKQI